MEDHNPHEAAPEAPEASEVQAAPPTSTLPDAPDQEQLDRIRRRRFERLGGNSTAPSKSAETSPAASTPISGASTPQEPPNILHTQEQNGQSEPPQSSMANPFEKALKPTGAHPPSITIKRTPGAAGVPSGVDPAKRHRELSEGKTASPARKPALPAQEESLEDFANRTLSQLFRITLDEGRQTDHSGHKLIYLPDLRQELEGEGLPPKLSAANLDTALMEACSKIQHTRRVLDYLLPCWKRITRSLRSHKSHGAEKDEVLKEAKRLCMSSCIFAITVPELYGREDAPVKDSLVPYFLVQPDADTGICPDFLKEAVSRLEEDDTIAPMLVKAVAELSTQLAQKNMNDDYQPYVVALKNLTQFPPITKAIAESPLFTMAVSAPNIEKMTILGPFFRISPLNPEVSTTFFGSPQTMNPNEIRIAQDALRMSLTTHQKDLFQITNAFVRASDVSKDRTLDWLAHIVNTNHMRAASRPDERKVSSDAFLYNVTVVLDCMCEPAMDSTFSRIGKIDPEYFRRTSHGPKGPRAPKVDIKEETKLNADQKSSDAFYERKLDGTPNFLSELFYITLAAHHYGTGATITRLGTIEREIRQLNRMLAEMAEERTNLAGNPFRLQQLDMALNRYKAVQTNVLRNKLALEAIMSDKDCQARSLIFMRYVSVFVLRMASGRDYIPGKPFALPLSLEEPEIFKNYPEYMVEEVVNHYKFIFSAMPQLLVSTQCDDLVRLCITFLENSDYIKNPGIKSGLVSILFMGTMRVDHRLNGVLGDMLTNDQFATDNLMHALMNFYIDAEKSVSFYNRHSLRYEIIGIIRCVWKNGIYAQRLDQQRKGNEEFFVRFVNLLLNDVTYLLDESITKLQKIHNLEEDLDRILEHFRKADSPIDNFTLSPDDKQTMVEEQQTKTKELEELEGQTKSLTQLSKATLDLMNIFTKAVGEAFTMPEIVQRLADMVDYNLETLVGPKQKNLKVKDPLKYKFDPRGLLNQLVSVYLNLGGSQGFVEAIARDGRSYKPSNFASAARILSTRNLKNPAEIKALEKLAENIALAKKLDDQADEDLGDIPDEFTDPIMATLMEDPVVLPMSKQTVDRSTIRSHLLSDPTDPFNRQPMTIDDVISNTELKEKIEAWKAERRAAAKQKLVDQMNATEADYSEDKLDTTTTEDNPEDKMDTSE